MDLTVLPEPLAICRLRPTDRIPSWALEEHESLVSITRTPEELSIVCEQSGVPQATRHEGDWKALKVEGPFDFSVIGVISSLEVSTNEHELIAVELGRSLRICVSVCQGPVEGTPGSSSSGTR